MTRTRALTWTLLLGLGLAALSILAGAQPAWAADGVDTTPNVVANTAWVGLAVSTVIPLLIALFTKPTTPAAVKGVANFILTGALAALTELLDNGGSLPIDEFIGAWLVAGFASQTMYSMVWKPTGVAPKLNAVGASPTTSPR